MFRKPKRLEARHNYPRVFTVVNEKCTSRVKQAAGALTEFDWTRSYNGSFHKKKWPLLHVMCSKGTVLTEIECNIHTLCSISVWFNKKKKIITLGIGEQHVALSRFESEWRTKQNAVQRFNILKNTRHEIFEEISLDPLCFCGCGGATLVLEAEI